MTESRLVSELTPDPRNVRTHDERNLEIITASLMDLGAARSIVVDEDGVILAGNATVSSAQRAGINRVRVIDADGTELIAVRRSNLTPEQKQRLALIDNRAAELAEWDTAALAALIDDGVEVDDLWSDDELATLLAQVDAATNTSRDDVVPDPPAVPVTKPGDLWTLGPHRLLCGDSTKVEDVTRLMDGQRAVLMATDPPYLVDYDGGNRPTTDANPGRTKKEGGWDQYREAEAADFFYDFLRAAIDHAIEPRAPIYQWHADRRRVLVENAWTRAGLLRHQTIVWVKSRAILTFEHFMGQQEPCLYGWIKGNQPETERRPPASETNVWMIDQQGDSDGIHLTQKPVEVVRRPIEYHTWTGELIYEPFAGSGTAIIAAETTGRRCYAMELSPEFCDVIVERWQQVTGRTATKERTA